jgi:hypothetical protein
MDINAAINGVINRIFHGETVRVKMQFRDEIMDRAVEAGIKPEIVFENEYVHIRREPGSAIISPQKLLENSQI